ncbi:MAG: transcription antitermination factor NusB [Longimicrobiales bacterium]
MQDRSKARAWALHTLYAWEARENADLELVLEEFLTRRRVAPSRRDYLRRLVEAVAEHAEAIDGALQDAISNWRLERLAVIDRNVLRLAAAEMIYFTDIPPRVSIREALKLAERYGTDQSPRFVNGVLDALMKSLEPEPELK